MQASHTNSACFETQENTMKTVVPIVLVSILLVAAAYTGGPATDEDRCLWPTNPNGPGCFLDQRSAQPT